MDKQEIDKQIQSQPPTKVGKTWFMKMKDLRNGKEGEIFAVEEKQAWNLLNNETHNNLYSRVYEIVGVSDGKTYVEMIKNADNNKVQLQQELNQLKKDQSRYIQTLDRLKFDELLDDDDEKVKRAKKLLADLDEKVEKVEADIQDIHRNTVKKAFNAELEKARGNIEMPTNQDVVTPNASGQTRNKILNQLGR